MTLTPALLAPEAPCTGSSMMEGVGRVSESRARGSNNAVRGRLKCVGLCVRNRDAAPTSGMLQAA
eukprot:2317294-Rhodomonas_salina.1